MHALPASGRNQNPRLAPETGVMHLRHIIRTWPGISSTRLHVTPRRPCMLFQHSSVNRTTALLPKQGPHLAVILYQRYRGMIPASQLRFKVRLFYKKKSIDRVIIFIKKGIQQFFILDTLNADTLIDLHSDFYFRFEATYFLFESFG